MTLVTERNAYQVALVITGKKVRTGSLYNRLLRGAAQRKTRNIVLRVYSQLPKPKYIEVLRDLIQNNISHALTVTYGGSSPEDLIAYLKREDGIDVYLDDDKTPFAEALAREGVKYELIPSTEGEEK
jgi:hypothetical protein